MATPLKPLLTSVVTLSALSLVRTAPAQTFHGPTPYLQRSDSPIAPLGVIYVETHEDAAFNAPWVSASAGTVLFPGNNTDSVDEDDGSIDGSGNGGSSLLAANGPTGITFTFDSKAPGGLPEHAGVVWTDGAGDVWFEAFDGAGVSLGTIGPTTIADNSISGETAEDHFFGVSHTSGVGSIRIWNTSGSMEVDHLQYSMTGLILEASKVNNVKAGDTLTMTTANGKPGNPVIMVVVQVFGAPVFLHILTSFFDGNGGWVVSAPVPPGLTGLNVGLSSIGAEATTGKLRLSNFVTINFG